jgi:hypothetical protein
MSNKPRNLWPKIVSCGHYVHVSVLNLLNAIACRTHAYGKKKYCHLTEQVFITGA